MRRRIATVSHAAAKTRRDDRKFQCMLDIKIKGYKEQILPVI
jgi:hypothetical protein